MLNRIRHQQIGGTPFRTLRESTEREGGQIVDLLREKAGRCLRENGFDENARPTSVDAKYLEGRPETLEEDAIREAAKSLPEQYDVEKPESTVNVSIDDVTVKRQESERPGERAETGEKKKSPQHGLPR